jgi:hypothetical protein
MATAIRREVFPTFAPRVVQPAAIDKYRNRRGRHDKTPYKKLLDSLIQLKIREHNSLSVLYEHKPRCYSMVQVGVYSGFGNAYVFHDDTTSIRC